MHVFKHPKYYKELRKRNRDLSELQQVKLERSVPQLDQVISDGTATAPTKRAPDPGLMKSQATSKSQAASVKLSNQPVQATSDKPLSHKHRGQASSHKQQAQ